MALCCAFLLPLFWSIVHEVYGAVRAQSVEQAAGLFLIVYIVIISFFIGVGRGGGLVM